MCIRDSPDGDTGIWCYTIDKVKKWERCDPLPPPAANTPYCDESTSDVRGADYQGCQRRTKSGRLCQVWAVNSPHTHKSVSYTHLRAHETVLDLVCRLLLEKKKTKREKLHYGPLFGHLQKITSKRDD
eukprot:TRINITY_DN4449_c0_g1_i2.p1 TRINITY_DN4449_c0_g1~~TRINITY_DN4449_c0_g1_i2.p1  ORF type:complete len:128 (-),score=33.37 TRINITY_DN4449_c0_g1_i2:6-389(-)